MKKQPLFTTMDWLTGCLGSVQGVGPVILVFSVVIAIGMALGRLRIAGISLGVMFELFAGKPPSLFADIFSV